MSFLWNLRTLKRVSPPGNKFSDADQDYNRLFEDDYVHKNHVTINYTGKGLNFVVKNKATLDLKGTSLQKADAKTSFTSKVVTQIADTAVETKIDNKGTVRLWADLGTYEVAGQPLTITGKLKTNNTFDRLSWAPTFHWRISDVLMWSRVHVKNNGQAFINSKTQLIRGDVVFGAISKISTSNWAATKWSIYSAYQVNRDATVYTDFVQKGTNQVLTTAALYRAKGNNYGLSLAYDLNNKVEPVKVQLGTVAKINNNTVLRAKINNRTELALSTKYVHSSNLNLQVGTLVTLNEPKSFTNTTVVPVPIGVALNFTYA